MMSPVTSNTDMPSRNLLLITIFAVCLLAIVTVRVRWDLSGRATDTDLVLFECQTIRHPVVGGEYDPGSGMIFVPKMTLLRIGTRDGKQSFFVRGAVEPHDALMMFRDKEPTDLQVRFDR